MANNYKIKMKDIQNKYKFKIFCAGYEYDDTELRNEISQRALITEAGRYVELELNPNTYVLTAKLKDKNNNVISTSTPIDLPLESMIVDCDYDATTKSLIITLQNGNTTSIPLGDLISGLATEEDLEEVDAKVDANITKISDLENELNQYKTIYNVLPKVEGNGESITLDNTGESILNLNPKGQCKQETTTGKNKAPINWATDFVTACNTPSIVYTTTKDNRNCLRYNPSAGYGDYDNKNFTLGLTFKENTQYTISYDFLKEDTTNKTIAIYYTDGTYTTCADASLVNTWTRQTITSTAGKTIKYIAPFYTNGTSYIDLNTWQIEEGTTATDYEKPTNGASPNPSYPQVIHEVSGDNTIEVVGKNLLDEEYYKNATYGSNVYKYTSLKFKGNRTLYFKTILKSGKTSISGLYLAVSNKNNPNLTGNKSYFLISNGTINPTASNYFDFIGEEDLYLDYYPTSVTPQDIFDTYNIMVSLENADYEPYNGDTYELDLGTLKMRGIGTYEDYFVRNSGKNLFDESLLTGITMNGITWSTENNKIKISGTSTSTYSQSGNTSINLQKGTYYFVKSGTTSLTYNAWLYNGDGTLIANTKLNNPFTINETATRIVLFVEGLTNGTNYNQTMNFQISKSNDNYEPFGSGKWCKYNAVGKKTLVGTETIDMETMTGKYLFKYNTYDMLQQNNGLGLSNYFTRAGTQEIGTARFGWINTTVYMYMDSNYSTIELFKTWLSTHNTELIYPLGKPYLSLIENETLISQLDKVEKALGKDGQTNISQINNDAPFIIDATALKDLSSL